MYSLRWDLFEELVGDVLRLHGYRIVHRTRAHDDGADFVLIGNDHEVIGIVECKSTQLIEASARVSCEAYWSRLSWSTSRVVLATSTRFTRGTKAASEQYGRHGFDVRLIDASELLRLLKVFQSDLPLHKLSDDDKRRLIEGNEATIKNHGLDFLRSEIQTP